MFSLLQIKYSNNERKWILMDVETCLPVLYPLFYVIDYLGYRALSTQSASLQSIKFFYEFWLKKFGVTFCYSFYQAKHNPLFAIEELSSFFLYLENDRSYQFKRLSISPSSNSIASRFTNAERVRTVIRFLSYLINAYISPRYIDDSPKEISLLAARMNTKLSLCKEEYRLLTSRKNKGITDSNRVFLSLTNDMVFSLYQIIAPSSLKKVNTLNPFPLGRIQFRNFLIIRLLLNYGLRVSELLLLEINSIKPNIQGDRYSLIVTTVDEDTDDPRHRMPSLKNPHANRVLELDEQDYKFIDLYIKKIRSQNLHHEFIFTSTDSTNDPLSYNTVYDIFIKIDAVITQYHPEYKSPDRFDSIQRITPHITRHTWAYLTLQRLYESKYEKLKHTSKLANIDFSIAGLMEEAMDELRLIGGWSQKSNMPRLYAKRFLSDKANSANIQRIASDKSNVNDIFDSIFKEFRYDC
jgi:integrase